MKNLIKQVVLSFAVLLFYTEACSQFELKSGLSGSFFASRPNTNGQIGTHLDLAYTPGNYFAIGLFGSYGKVFSTRDKHYILSTGAVIQIRGYSSEKIKIISLLNIHVGYSSEYEKHHYTYGDNNQYEKKIDRHTEGLSFAVRAGIASNFERTGPFQFQFDIGILEQSNRLEISNHNIAFFQSRLLLVYSL